MRRPLVLIALLAAVLAAGCGGEDSTGRSGADLSNGKELFLANPDPSQPACASCHTLADAGSQSTIGPNLDDAFGYDREQCFDESSFFDVTLGQIDIPNRGGAMPADIYEGQDAVDVAAYVATVAGADQPCPTDAGAEATAP